MAKKITFLLVMMFILLMASVTAFAGGTDSSSETGFTKDKADLDEITSEISVGDLENKYGDIFFDEKATSNKEYISINYGREKDSDSELRYNFTGSVVGSSSSPAIMLMYIKKDGKYVPLKSVETGTNFTQGTLITCSKVDLEYLGSNMVNDVRIIAFRKSEISNLAVNKNLQITDLQITVRPWNLIEKINLKINQILNNLNPTAP